MKFLQINDVHLSDKNPRYRTDSYKEDVLDKLRFCMNLAEEKSVDFVLFTGDLFHVPQASKVSHRLVNDWLSIFDLSPCPIFIVPGNHDISGGRLDNLDRQPIGTLGAHSKATILEDGIVHDINGVTLCGVGWNYSISADYIKSKLPKEKIDVLALHAPISLKSNPFFETIGWEELDGTARLVSYGHMHTPEEPGRIEDTWFVNPGSLSRRSLGKSQIDDPDQIRTPQVALIDITKDSVETTYFVVDCRPASEVYRFEHYELQQENSKVSEFVKSLRSSVVSQITTEDIISLVNKSTDDVDIRRVAEELLRL